MSDLFSFTPAPPHYRVDWDGLDAAYDWVRRLRGCPQDPRHHAEGDVWMHTRLVCEELAALPAWRVLAEADRRVVFAAAVLHDVAKPDCTRHDADGRITSRGHSRQGSIVARNVLWREQVPFAVRERVAALVRFHQVPYWLLDRATPERQAAEVSQTARCDHLALLAEADVRGRICEDRGRLLDNVALFAEFCREENCLDRPRSFASDHARFLYFRDPRRHPDQPVHEAFRADVVLMSGLPGSGKDHWLRHQLPKMPVVSLDALREELDVAPTEEQGTVIQAARATARDFLRRGTSFAWNGTNVSRQIRSGLVDLFAGYGARVRIVYVEASVAYHAAQNKQRAAPVPEAVVERMRRRWEVPDITEAHTVEYVVRAF